MAGLCHAFAQFRVFGKIGTGHEEGRLYALVRQGLEHPLDQAGQGTVVEGEHHFALLQGERPMLRPAVG